MKINPKSLFLIDSIGALFSTFMLGVILTKFESVFGMPVKVLYYLAVIAVIFAIYSFFCFWKTPRKWQPFLAAIAFANLIYCFLTIVLVLHYQSKLTVFGNAYFIGELIILFVLISVEFKAGSSSKQ